MNDSAKIPPALHKVAVMGAGAVGSFYGAMLARAGHAVTLIGRPAHVQAIQRDGLQLEMAGQRHVVRLDAGSDPAALAGADLVLCCVKSGDTEAAALQMAPHLGPATLLMSLQNGVDNAATLARHVPCRVVPAVVYVAVALGGPGVVRHFGRGDLAIGAMPGGTQSSVPEWPTLQTLVDFFASAQVPVRIVPDVAVELWAKLLVNCAYNAISALAQMPYARLAAHGRHPCTAGGHRARGHRGGGGMRRQPAAAGLAGRGGEDRRRHAAAAVVHGAGHGAAQAQRDRPSQRLCRPARR